MVTKITIVNEFWLFIFFFLTKEIYTEIGLHSPLKVLNEFLVSYCVSNNSDKS